MNMVSPLPLLLLALTATPGAQQQQQSAVCTDSEGEECASSKWAALISSEIRGSLAQIERGVSRGALRQAGAAEQGSVLDLMDQVEDLKNATAQLLGVLNTVKSRQAASSAVQVLTSILFVCYLGTIAVIAVTKRCKKVSERQRQREFERLEMQLRSSKAKRRAAAAQEKSAQAHSLE